MLGVKFLIWFKVEILLSANSVFVFHNGIIEKIGKNYDLNLRKKEGGLNFCFFVDIVSVSIQVGYSRWRLNIVYVIAYALKYFS